MSSSVPPAALATAAGLAEGEGVYSDPENDICIPSADGSIDTTCRTDLPPMEPIHKGPPIRFTWPVEVHVPVHGYLVPLELAGAEAIGKYEDEDIVLAAHHKYGQGEVYYFGTYMGLALEKSLPGAHRLLKTILQRHVRPIVTGERLRPRLLESDNGALLAVFNDNRTEHLEERITIPDRYRQARDIYSNREVKLTNGRCVVDVEAEAVRVFRLSG